MSQLTTQQAADALGISASRVRQLAAQIAVGSKIGNVWVFSNRDLQRLRARQTAPGPAPKRKKGSA